MPPMLPPTSSTQLPGRVRHARNISQLTWRRNFSPGRLCHSPFLITPPDIHLSF